MSVTRLRTLTTLEAAALNEKTPTCTANTTLLAKTCSVNVPAGKLKTSALEDTFPSHCDVYVTQVLFVLAAVCQTGEMLNCTVGWT